MLTRDLYIQQAGRRFGRGNPQRMDLPHWAEKSYPTLSYFGEAERGGHFAAWEEPELFAAEMRAAFRPLR